MWPSMYCRLHELSDRWQYTTPEEVGAGILLHVVEDLRPPLLWK